jgi:hypothetical protein
LFDQLVWQIHLACPVTFLYPDNISAFWSWQHEGTEEEKLRVHLATDCQSFWQKPFSAALFSKCISAFLFLIDHMHLIHAFINLFLAIVPQKEITTI